MRIKSVGRSTGWTRRPTGARSASGRRRARGSTNEGHCPHPRVSGEGQGMGAGRGSSRSSGRRLRPLESLNVDAYFKEGLERVCFGHIRVRWGGGGCE